jgi:hypothetical protein
MKHKFKVGDIVMVNGNTLRTEFPFDCLIGEICEVVGINEYFQHPIRVIDSEDVWYRVFKPFELTYLGSVK